MPITYNDTAVLILSGPAPPGFISELENTGFHTIAVQGQKSVRSAISDLLGKGAEAIVTVNPAEGYTVSDVTNAVDQLMRDPARLCAGEPREPAAKNAAEKLYSFLAGVNPTLAQTSLYAMSAKTAKTMTVMKSSEENFIFNIPLQARISGIEIAYTKTDVTVPAPELKSMLTRSFKLYDVFIRFSIAAMIAYIVDIATFGLFEVVFGYLSDEYKILVATILSRILCSLATYILNRSAVFRSETKQASSVPRFIILSVAQLLVSWLLVWGIGTLLNANDFGNMLLKVVVDGVIFIASFTIMRDWVFKKSEDDKEQISQV